MTLDDIIRNGDQFEFIPGIESQVVHIKKNGQTSSLVIREVGMLFSHHFKLYYDSVNGRFTAATMPREKRNRKRIHGSNIDSTLMEFQRWEKQNGA